MIKIFKLASNFYKFASKSKKLPFLQEELDFVNSLPNGLQPWMLKQLKKLKKGKNVDSSYFKNNQWSGDLGFDQEHIHYINLIAIKDDLVNWFNSTNPNINNYSLDKLQDEIFNFFRKEIIEEANLEESRNFAKIKILQEIEDIIVEYQGQIIDLVEDDKIKLPKNVYKELSEIINHIEYFNENPNIFYIEKILSNLLLIKINLYDNNIINEFTDILKNKIYQYNNIDEEINRRLSQSSEQDWRPTETIPEDYYAL